MKGALYRISSKYTQPLSQGLIPSRKLMLKRSTSLDGCCGRPADVSE